MTKARILFVWILCLSFLFITARLTTMATARRGAGASPRAQEPGPDATQNEWRTLKQEMERAAASADQLNRYRELQTQISAANPPHSKRRKAKQVAAEAVGCIGGNLTSGTPTFDRPQLQSSAPGYVQPCVLSATGSAVHYDFYEFNVTGCVTPSVTANTCGTAACSTTGTLADSVLFIYQKSDASASSPGNPIFNPASPCTNIVAANDDFCGSLSQVTSAVMPGNFVVVVTTFNSGDTGTYSLSVGAPGCTISQVLACTITCPANISKSNDPNQCGAVTTYSAPTTTGSCGTVTCSPSSGSFFPTGTTTVSCSTTAGPSCSFTVTVQDTQAPTVTCPANITTTENPAGSGAATVNYSTPTASDNCPGAKVSCAPASGSSFPVGTTTVRCNATDASLNTASCSFTVTVNPAIAFSNCLQDDSNPANVVLFDLTTGKYRFCCNGVVVASGTAKINQKGLVYTLQDYSNSTRRVLITIDLSQKKGNASVQSPPGTTVCTITDRNTTNDVCTCGGA